MRLSPAVAWASPSLPLGLGPAFVQWGWAGWHLSPLWTPVVPWPPIVPQTCRVADRHLPCLVVHGPRLWLLCVPGAWPDVDGTTSTDCVLRYVSPFRTLKCKLLMGWQRGEEGGGCWRRGEMALGQAWSEPGGPGCLSLVHLGRGPGARTTPWLCLCYRDVLGPESRKAPGTEAGPWLDTSARRGGQNLPVD